MNRYIRKFLKEVVTKDGTYFTEADSKDIKVNVRTIGKHLHVDATHTYRYIIDSSVVYLTGYFGKGIYNRNFSVHQEGYVYYKGQTAYFESGVKNTPTKGAHAYILVHLDDGPEFIYSKYYEKESNARHYFQKKLQEILWEIGEY